MARERLLSRAVASLAALLAAAVAAPGPALADYQICNKTSYVLDAALAVETGGATATQGWFQIAPGICTIVLKGEWTGDRYFLHTRTPAFYREAPEAGHISRMFCVRRGDFLIAGAERCPDASGILAAFSEVVPERGIKVTTTDLTGPERFDLTQARLAGAQRLLALLDFDPGPVDGLPGEATQLAIADFIAARQLPEEYADPAVLFDELLKAALAETDTVGLTLCNRSQHRLLAAVGVASAGRINARGWYQLPAGGCQQVSEEPVTATPHYIFAQAVGADNNPVIQGGQPLVWGGETVLCTKDSRFDISDHEGCEARALRATGFRAVRSGGSAGHALALDRDNAGMEGGAGQ